MRHWRKAGRIGVVAALASGLCGAADGADSARAADWVLRQGRLYVQGEWVFLKIGKPLRDFSREADCRTLAADLGKLRDKGYNAIELNCYWHHFDRDGDGRPEVSLQPLATLIDAIADAGMYPCLAVETYGVGGGQIPAGFWERFPDAVATNAEGKPVRDTEYGFNTAVPSLFHPGYLEASREFIRNLTRGIPHRRILHYETTVEPQFMGQQDLDYGDHARRAYAAWRVRNGLPGPEWPTSFPVAESFRRDPTWLRFRAESLADWVNGDAAAFRSVAGADAYIAVDYLETSGPEMSRRNGDSLRFLTALEDVNIIQVNWHWHLGSRAPHRAAYANVRAVMAKTGRDWAVSEHMTLNGSDYQPGEVEAMLRNALSSGTGYAWEFVNLAAASGDPFSLYQDDWSPKPLMAEVDGRWDEWLQQIRALPAPAAPR
jgi:hypothetical protein